MVKLITGKSKEYPKINFGVDRNLICVKRMVQLINDRLLYPLNDADITGWPSGSAKVHTWLYHIYKQFLDELLKS